MPLTYPYTKLRVIHQNIICISIYSVDQHTLINTYFIYLWSFILLLLLLLNFIADPISIHVCLLDLKLDLLFKS